MAHVSEQIGDNKEFAVASISDVTIYFGHPTNTSADDTATVKYIDSPHAVKSFCLRPDQTVQIVSMNGVTFTDPYTAVKDKGITEKLDAPILSYMVIRTTVANTNIKLRVK
jgi:hypothetical protein